MVLPSWLKRKTPDTEPLDEEQQLRSRSILRTRSLSTMNFSVDKTIGWKIRDFFGYLEKTLGPYLKKIFPNFVAVHYFYTIAMTIAGSILLYPVKNLEYIDALFFAACSATQAGLNTVDVNTTTLYQQVAMYIMCCLTTPIFIHGSLAFLRLYWFERYFDDIRESSKLNFKMRRTATIAARTQSMEKQKTLESQRRQSEDIITPHPHPSNDAPNQAIDESLESKDEEETSSSELAVSSPVKFTQSSADLYHLNNNGVEHLSEPSDEEDEAERRSPRFTHSDNQDETNQSANIKFAELPKPRRDDVEPRDVYMSISMLRNNQLQKPFVDNEDDGPALVIRGPAEREPKHHRKNSTIQFDLSDRPKRPKHFRKRSGLRRSFIFNKHNEEEEDDDDDENENATDNNEEEEHDGNELARAQSHLPLPSSDQTGGAKFGKRSNTLDGPSRGVGLLKKSPTFEKFVKQRIKRPTRQFRRRLSSSVIADNSSGNYSNTDSDNESEENNDLRRQMSASYLSWDPQIGRNSKFVNLSDQQKEELGGVEYRAIKLLAKVLVAYYVGFHVIGFLFLVPWIQTTSTYKSVVTNSGVSLNWWGFFTSMSAFNDLGYTLTPDSMVSFKTSPFALLVLAVLIIIGNTGFPILLRFIIWVLFKFSRDLSLFKESLGFLLDHPRRCFTLLFPSAPTWWLLFILVALNVIDLILFIILDLGAEVLDGLSTGQKVLDGIFQAVSTRTAGFACVDLSQLHPSVQVSYMVMMYISVLPLAISIRRTNVYEEQSLGVYMGKSDENANNMDHDKTKPTSFIGAHLRKQLSFDLWFVFLGLFIICISEGDKLQATDLPDFNIFRVMFEVVSAYGTVGLSLGYPNTTPSFSGQFNVVSKLVIIALMIRGRMRGLPYSLDRSIIFPSARMERFDMLQDLQHPRTLSHAETIGSVNDPVLEFFKSAAPKVLRERIRRPSFFAQRSSVNTTGTGRNGGRQGSSHFNTNSETSNIHFQHRAGDRNAVIDEDDDEDGNQNLNHISTNNSEGTRRPLEEDQAGHDSLKNPNFGNFGYSSGDISSITRHDSIASGRGVSPNRTEEYELDYFGPKHKKVGSTTSL